MSFGDKRAHLGIRLWRLSRSALLRSKLYRIGWVRAIKKNLGKSFWQTRSRMRREIEMLFAKCVFRCVTDTFLQLSWRVGTRGSFFAICVNVFFGMLQYHTRQGYGHYDFTICPLSGRVWFCILLPGRSTSWLEHATTYLGRCNIVPWHLDPQNSFPTTDSSNILVPITSSGTILWYYGVFFLWYRHGLMEVSLGQYMKQVWPEGYDSTMLFFYGTDTPP